MAATAAATIAPGAVVSAQGKIAAFDVAMAAPELAALQQERAALESRMASVTGGMAAGQSVRYPVASLVERRNEHQQWAGARDQRKPMTVPSGGRRSTAIGATGASAVTDRPPPSLRTTPGEVPASDRTRADRGEWSRKRDGAARPQRGDGGEVTVDSRRRADGENQAGMDGGAGPRPERDDAVRSMRRQADDRVRSVSRPFVKALDQLRRPSVAVAREWTGRVRKLVPELGRGDSYDRWTQRVLRVDVGTIESIGAQSEKLRSQAQELREAAELADEKDDARREQAIERLRKRKQQGDG